MFSWQQKICYLGVALTQLTEQDQPVVKSVQPRGSGGTHTSYVPYFNAQRSYSDRLTSVGPQSQIYAG